jgi:hypothetical protein
VNGRSNKPEAFVRSCTFSNNQGLYGGTSHAPSLLGDWL